MNIVFFDDHSWKSLLPLTYTRPMADIRCGIFTNIERLNLFEKEAKIYFLTTDFLQKKYKKSTEKTAFYINGKWILNFIFFEKIKNLAPNTGFKKGDDILAFHSINLINDLSTDLTNINWIELDDDIILINESWDIFKKNEAAINLDWAWHCEGRISEKISNTNTIIGDKKNLFVEKGATIEASILNLREGKMYIAKDAEVMEGSMLRAPFVLGEQAVIKMGSKVYGGSTVGKGCKVGGEISNVVFFANSNKGHDGFLGNTVVGEWCNFGADSNNSNLKNNYEEVKLWSESQGRFVKTGLQFCGLIMADHSKCGINTMFNTGTVVGVSCNIFGSGFPRNFIPSFSWGGASGFTEYKLDKALTTMQKVYERRNITLTEIEIEIFQHIYNQTQNQRNY